MLRIEDVKSVAPFTEPLNVGVQPQVAIRQCVWLPAGRKETWQRASCAEPTAGLVQSRSFQRYTDGSTGERYFRWPAWAATFPWNVTY